MSHPARLPGRRVRFVYTRPGKGTQTYTQRVVIDRPDLKAVVTEHYAGPTLIISGGTALEPGSPVVWFIFPGSYFDIGAFHDRARVFTGWYTNLCTPVEFSGHRWSSTDLFLDLWQGASGTEEWLDEEEFTDAAARGVLQHTLADAASDERQRIEVERVAGRWPPRAVLDMDLSTVW